MGGLMAYYAMLMKPEVFGKGGIFSPSFWVAPEILTLTDSLGGKQTGKFFFYMGGQEDSTGIAAYNKVTEKLGLNSNTLIYSVIDPESKHNEKAWRKWFAEFYNWIMADGFNNVIKLTGNKN